MELNGLAVELQTECLPDTCSQMTSTEQWIFLCAAHKTPKECPAIDYTRHTLDGAACLLNSNKYFPSRYNLYLISCIVTTLLNNGPFEKKINNIRLNDFYFFLTKSAFVLLTI